MPINQDAGKNESHLIHYYEQLRAGVLTSSSLDNTKSKLKGVGLVIQRGVASWIEALGDMEPIVTNHKSLQSLAQTGAHKPLQSELTNILTEIALSYIGKEQPL